MCSHCPHGIKLCNGYYAVLTQITCHRRSNAFGSYKRQKKFFASHGIPGHGVPHLAMKPLHHFSVFVKLEDYFYILSFSIFKKH
jgi:hypothetical protein